MRVLLVLIVAGFGWVLMGRQAIKAKLSPGSSADYDHRIERAWSHQQKAIRTHGFGSAEYLRRQEIYLALKSERETEFGNQD